MIKHSSIVLAISFALLGPLQLISQSYWQQGVKYEMDIDFDVKSDQFSGSQKLTYFNNSPDTLNRVFYHLYFNAFQPNSAMDTRSRNLEDPDYRVTDRIQKLDEKEWGFHKINSLKQDGADLTYKVEGTVLEVSLRESILPGESTVFDMTFESQVPVQIRRSGRDNKEGIEYSMAQWFPKMAEYDKKGWHAHPYVAREFYAPWGDFSVNLTISKKYMVAATGILQNPEEIGFGYEKPGSSVAKKKDKKLTWKFKAEKVHDFVWTADPDYIHTKAQVPGGPELHFFYQGDTLTENWEQLPEYTVKAFQYISEKFGKYPYSKYSVIQGGDGGMEYPMATLITGHRSLGSLVGVTVHEALHSWYQGLLATNESYYAWMDEGYTSYAASLTMSHLFDGDPSKALEGNYKGYFALANSDKEEPLSTHSDHFQTNFGYGLGSYQKGAVSIAQLGYIIGEEHLSKGLKRYYYEWRFKHPDLNDFIRVMEKTSDLELDWYYEYWINSTHNIDYAIENLSGDGTKSVIEIKKKGVMPMPLDIVVTLSDGSSRAYNIPLDLMRGNKPAEVEGTVFSKDWNWTYNSYSLEVSIPFENIAKIEIDESQRMADMDRSNNVWEK